MIISVESDRVIQNYSSNYTHDASLSLSLSLWLLKKVLVMAPSDGGGGGGALSGSRGGNARGRRIDDEVAGSSRKPRYRRTLDAASEKLLRRLNGKDVKMHPSIGRRKKRMCIVLPGQVSLSAAGGTIGMLEKLDTKEPVLYVDFPNVRMYVCSCYVSSVPRVHTR